MIIPYTFRSLLLTPTFVGVLPTKVWEALLQKHGVNVRHVDNKLNFFDKISINFVKLIINIMNLLQIKCKFAKAGKNY